MKPFKVARLAPVVIPEPQAGHRYWRIVCTGAPPVGDYSIGQMEMYTESGGPSVCTGGVASAINHFGAYVPANAFDADATTAWVSTSSDAWLQYDFGAGNEKQIVGYGLGSVSGWTEIPRQWVFQYSDNGTDWTTADTKTDISWSGDGTLRRFMFGSTEPAGVVTRSLLHFDGSSGSPDVIDAVPGRTWWRTVTGSGLGNAILSDAQAKFGATSYRKTLSDVWNEADVPVLADETGKTPHTLEIWAWIDDIQGPPPGYRHDLFSQEAGGGNSDQIFSIGFREGDDGKLSFYQGNAVTGGTGERVLKTDSILITPGTWNHLALDYDGTYCRLFVNGVLGAKAARDYGWRKTANRFKLSQTLVAGYPEYRGGMNGYLDEFRASVGSRYGSDAGFFVPTSAFPAPTPAATGWNPSDKSPNITLSDSNKGANTAAGGSSAWSTLRAINPKSTGKWYCEFRVDGMPSGNTNLFLGVADAALAYANFIGTDANSAGYFAANGGIRTGNNNVANGGTYAQGDVIGVAYDADTGKVWFSKNGTWVGAGNPSTGTSTVNLPTGVARYIAASLYYGSDAQKVTLLPGLDTQRYVPPEGFSAWG